jgi:thiol:disulfide interchange protein
MKQLLAAIIISVIAIGCGSAPPEKRNSDLTVTYEGKIVYEASGRYTSEAELRRALAEDGRKYLIFAADWCEACNFLRKAVDQAELTDKVMYLNIDKPWVQALARHYKIKGVPLMFVLDTETRIVDIREGPGAIVIRLLIDIEK